MTGAFPLVLLVLAAGVPSSAHSPARPAAPGDAAKGMLRLIDRPAGGVLVSRRTAEILNPLASDGEVVALVDLGLRIDWDRLDRNLAAEAVPMRARAARVRGALAAAGAEHLERAAAGPLRDLHRHRQLQGKPSALATLAWVQVRTTKRGVERLMRDPRVRRLDLLRSPMVEEVPREDISPAALLAPAATAWAAEGVGAGAAWERGLCGRGRRVGLLDGGFDPGHAALRGRFSRAQPIGWEPRPGSHGTAVVSLAVGTQSDGKALGPAPEASWVAADPFPRGSYDPAGFERVASWVLDVSPDVVVLPWKGSLADDAEGVAEVLSAWRCAGVFVAIAAGNSGPKPGENGLPASLGGLGPGRAPAFSVGAVAGDGSPYVFSARGPSRHGGNLFPLVSAPGAGLIAAAEAPEEYATVSGTSFAVGVVGGMVALLREADPELSVAELEAVIAGTARDLGEPGPDLVHGYGAIDIEAALREIGAIPRR